MGASEPSVPRRVQPVYSTIAAQDIAEEVASAYDLGPVAACELIRRGFNDVYLVSLASGDRCIARLATLRARGPANSAFEAAFLEHLKACSVAVAAPIRDSSGQAWRTLEAPEGLRDLIVFEHLDGEPPRADLADIARMGEELARIHQAGETYSGPPSLYGFGLPDLHNRPLAWLLTASPLDGELSAEFAAIADRLAQRISKAPALSPGICHGDCHGGNTHMIQRPDGARKAAFFDFDDAGPGYLAFDLALYLWALLHHLGAQELDAKTGEAWSYFIDGYRRVRDILTADYMAISMFVNFRQLWFLGEYASRIPQWGLTTLSHSWLTRQLKLLQGWEDLTTPPT
ncbi:phosphotransferase enzyme family protein [Phenylobacterium aquaticum]|uniref:phosphotransferase enzyme family protein n=1 Tax=Phenylobacterium aquaticum TaxID=1763816 RepID=UPI0026F17FDF|nr:phosphotransferase [Phenylobacterium aquaticum]